jgi:predicted GIY-YIG superfamily endonuclease
MKARLRGQHFVYFYRTRGGEPIYVGYGRDVERATSHLGRSHNAKLERWLERNEFDLRVAGPYATEAEAKRVEAALISGIQPRFNVAPGEGPRFVPLGIPPDLHERPQMEELSLADVGRAAGGALLVYLAPGVFLGDGRKRFDPARPNNEETVSHIEQKWQLGRLIERWSMKPQSAPRILLGVYGKVDHRFVAAALEIDRKRWGDPDLRCPQRPGRPKRWRVPLVDRRELDACGLRGRRLQGVKFGRFSHLLHIWVDANGRRRHP